VRNTYVRAVLFLLVALFISHSARGQITHVTDATSTPIAGAGHDYIHLLNETVNPANGSISVRIDVPVPKSRGLTLPFSFAYYSNGVHHLVPGVPPFVGQISWRSNQSYLSQGGWSFSSPMITYSQFTVTVINSPNNYNCNTWANYVFSDPGGGRHSLSIGTQLSNGSGGCQGPGFVSRVGGDSEFEGTLPNSYPDNTNPSNPAANPVSVFSKDGTVYSFPPIPHQTIINGTYNGSTALASSIEDRNGNVVNVTDSGNGVFSYLDTAGRTVISTNGFGPSGATNTVTVGGLIYQATWKTVTSNYTVGTNQIPVTGSTCATTPSSDSESQTVISQITLPNGKSYKFFYGTDNPNPSFQNPYGLLSEIDYPNGGSVKYKWGLPAGNGVANSQFNEIAVYPGRTSSGGTFDDGCLFQYQAPVVISRTVSFDGSSAALTQTFSYATAWSTSGNPAGTSWTSKSTSVTTTDNVTGKSSLTSHTYSPVTLPQQPMAPTNFPEQAPVESQIKYFDWGNTTSPLQTVNKTWYDMFNLASEQTVLDNSQASKIVYCYAGNNCSPPLLLSQLIEKDDYDFGQSTPTRKTATSYQSFSGTPGIITDRPCRLIIYAGSTPVSETDYLYDGAATVCGASGSTPTAAVSSLPSGTHDETLYGPSSSTPRGNATKVIRKCMQSCSDSTTTNTFDETGQVLTKTDPCGNATCADMTGSNHTTTYSYADNFDSPPSGNTNAYLTKVTDALGHFATFKYAYADGQLISATDPNSRVTSYIYADSLRRPTETDFADGGKTTITYNDATYNASTPSPSVTTTKLGSPSPNITTLTAFDGLGQSVRSVLTSDPDCSSGDRTDTTYDGLGRVYKVSNPYCTTGDLTYGLTTYTYDALGRTTQVAHPDGSTILRTYTGSATQVQDEGNGTQRVTRVLQTDGLGRLTQVVEDPATLKFETDYQYDALDNLLCAAQKGTNSGTFTNCASTPASWRPRTFTYDSLSRLVCASNPENSSAACPTTATGTYTSGTTGYVYDANGNLASKTSPAPNQTGSSTVTTSYQNDALNRLTQKSYSDGVTLPALFGYDQTLITMGSQQFNISNSIGRMSWNCILHPGSPPSCAGSMTANSYDPMGRLAELWQENPVNSNNIFVSYGYDLIGDETARSLNNLNYAATFGGAARLLTFSQTNFTNATNPPNLLTSPHYNAFGQLSLATFANGLSESWNYDNRGRLKGAAVGTNCGNGTGTCSGSSVYSFSLGFAPNSNVMTANDSINGNWTYSYDQLNRLSGASSTSGQSCKGLSWTYDAWGNRTDQTVTNGTCNTFHAMAGTNNRLASPYTYDAAGNTTYDGVHHYTYDPENRIISVDNGATTYTYDALGRRAAKTTGGSVTDFIYDREDHVILTNPATPTLIEMYAAGLHLGTYVLNAAQTATVLYYDHADWLGTERARADLSGNACEKISSLPFGDGQTITGTCGDISPRHFTGKERDSESGLDNFGARYDSSSMGRFMSPDDTEAEDHAGDPQGLNLYSYVRGNPTNATDPDGHDCVLVSGNNVYVKPGSCSGINGGTYVPGTVDPKSGQYDPKTHTLTFTYTPYEGGSPVFEHIGGVYPTHPYPTEFEKFVSRVAVGADNVNAFATQVGIQAVTAGLGRGIGLSIDAALDARGAEEALLAAQQELKSLPPGQYKLLQQWLGSVKAGSPIKPPPPGLTTEAMEKYLSVAKAYVNTPRPGPAAAVQIARIRTIQATLGHQ
jgi:RHS repeat-associated protein